MKRIVLLTIFLGAVALCAGAQTYIDFHQMPAQKTPTLMPDYYPDGMNLYWDGFFYVTPGMWNGAGAGFWVDPTVQHNTVVFVGGPTCNLAATCVGAIKVAEQPNAQATFTPWTIVMSAGWVRNNVTITAYNHSKFVGKMTVKLTTKPQLIAFPAVWHQVSQLVFTPDFIPTTALKPNAGSVLIYGFSLTMN